MGTHILIVDDEAKARDYLSELLADQGYRVTAVASLEAARDCLKRENVDVVLLDVRLGAQDGLELLYELETDPDRPAIIPVTAHGHIQMAVKAMKHQAFDFLEKPVDVERLFHAVRSAAEHVRMARELQYLRLQQMRDMPDMVSRHPEVQRQVEIGLRAAYTATPILITGETGTGKSLLARFLHRHGPRKEHTFVHQNCAGIPDDLLETELFGSEQGAYTGAKRKRGLVELADEGTLFLDEISTLSPRLQSKLLTFLDTFTFRRLGSEEREERRVDIHLISATNRDLPQMIAEEQFRSDLYHRLNVIQIHLPPLRERVVDIPDLVSHFIQKHAPRMGVTVRDLTPRALEALQTYPWPGNIRELENTIQRALVLCDGEVIDVQHLVLHRA